MLAERTAGFARQTDGKHSLLVLLWQSLMTAKIRQILSSSADSCTIPVADPHPGNLLATPDGKLAFLDFGMMSETPSKARLAIIGHVVHLVNR